MLSIEIILIYIVSRTKSKNLYKFFEKCLLYVQNNFTNYHNLLF